jgi:hypothetical protein
VLCFISINCSTNASHNNQPHTTTTNHSPALFGASPETSLHRSDFFPGLGWLLPRRTYDLLIPKWPAGYWDDWMREPAQRGGRACLRPEVSRVRNVGTGDGVSGGQFGAHLRGVRTAETAAQLDMGTAELFTKARYDAALRDAVEAAHKVSGISGISRRPRGCVALCVFVFFLCALLYLCVFLSALSCFSSRCLFYFLFDHVR